MSRRANVPSPRSKRKKHSKRIKRPNKVHTKSARRQIAVVKGNPTNASKKRVGKLFEDLVAVQARLRAPGGCPWDREQTHTTLRTYLLEETYEVLDALESSDDAKFAEELGDL